MQTITIISLTLSALSLWIIIRLRMHYYELEEYVVRLHKRVIEVEKRMEEINPRLR